MKRLWKVSVLVLLVACLTFIGVSLFSKEETPVQKSQPVKQQQVKKPESKPSITPDGIIALVNEERAKAGVAPLGKSEALMRSAQAKCDDMIANDYYGHVNPNTGKNGYEFAAEYLPEAVYTGENIIMRMDSDKGAMNGWMQSNSHREAILSTRYTFTGIATCQDLDREPGYFVVEHFAQTQ